MCMFCRSLFVLLYFYFWLLCCLFFFELWLPLFFHRLCNILCWLTHICRQRVVVYFLWIYSLLLYFSYITEKTNDFSIYNDNDNAATTKMILMMTTTLRTMPMIKITTTMTRMTTMETTSRETTMVTFSMTIMKMTMTTMMMMMMMMMRRRRGGEGGCLSS
jgi:hypothetical protein